MRTTITLDPDVQELVERAMRERGQPFKEVVNRAVRDALAPAASFTPIRTLRLGGPLAGVDLHHASRIAGDLEDDAVAHKLELRK